MATLWHSYLCCYFLLWIIIRFVEEEDREARFYRVLSASILTLGKLISVTSEKAKEDMQEHYLNLLREKKFWKCARHKSPHVSLPIKINTLFLNFYQVSYDMKHFNIWNISSHFLISVKKNNNYMVWRWSIRLLIMSEESTIKVDCYDPLLVNIQMKIPFHTFNNNNNNTWTICGPNGDCAPQSFHVQL